MLTTPSTTPGGGGQRQRYRLVTSILDPAQAHAAELYHQWGELEGALDELKTHQRSPRAVQRSKTPEGVEQEVYAHLLLDYAIRRRAGRPGSGARSAW